MGKEIGIRSYKRKDSVVFWKTREKYGELSNMASGFPLLINDLTILSTEALYQLCKYPHIPDLQKKIIGQTSPLLAKRICREFKGREREDWMLIRTTVMRWCLRTKLVQNWLTFKPILMSTEEKDIVEFSNQDDFWGAMPWDGDLLQGKNVLGRLLMELRKQVAEKPEKSDWEIGIPPIKSFLLLGKQIESPKRSNGQVNDMLDLL